MKRIISIIVSLTLMISLVPLSALATTDEETKLTKQEMLQNLQEKYGESGILEDGVEYTWDGTQNEGTIESLESQIMPRWPTNENAENADEKIIHDDIIDAANADVYGEPGTSYIPNMYLDLVKRANKECDAIKHSDNAEYNASVVHGTGNYVITLRYLWQFLLSLEPHKSERTISQKTLDTYITEAHQAGIKNIPSGKLDNESFIELTEFVRFMLETYYNDPEFAVVEGQHQGRRCKFIVVGIMCHFLGDLYAHRTIVDKSLAPTLLTDAEAEEFGINKVVYNETVHKNLYFNSSDFLGNSYYNIEKSLADDKKVNAFQNYDTMKDKIFLETVHSNDVVAFNELKQYYKTPLEGEDATNAAKMLNAYYVDNGRFLYGRVEDAIIATECFLSNFNDGFDVFTIDPVCVNIKKFQAYINAANVNYTYDPVEVV